MKKYYFYTDPNLLTAQTTDQAFGPVGNASGKDRYRITNLHTATNAPAIAVCDGIICVQEVKHQNGTLESFTIILKPNYQPPFDFPFIKYFIYKGVDPASIVNATSIDFSKSGDIPFIEDMYDSWKDPISNDAVADSKDLIGLIYKANVNFPVDNVQTPICEDTDPIDNLFYYPSPDFQLPIVKAGDKIGEFASEFGFEIVLERLGYEPQIKLARTKTNYIEVTTIDNPLNEIGHISGKTWAIDEADYFLHWHEKESCLNYIDPCAFYGSFCGTKVFYRTGTNLGKEKCNSPEKINTELLQSFVNKNKIYLDIRNDYGYSLNYYKDYGETIALINKDDNSQNTAFKTTKGNWPICELTLIPTIENAGTIVRDKFFNTQLALPNNNNNRPLVYLSKAYVNNFRRLKRKHRVQTPSKTLSADFLEPIDLTFITINDGSDKFLSNYYKLNLYDKDRDNNPIQTPLSPSKEYYLNGLFRPLDLKQPSLIRNNSFSYTIWHEELLVDQTKYGGPQFIAQVGIAKDEHHTTLFAFPYYFVLGGFTNVTPDAFTSFVNQSKVSKKMFLQDVFDIFTHKELRKQDIKITELDNTITELDTVVVQNSPFTFLQNAFRAKENPEDYVFIMFGEAEYNSIITSLSNHTTIPQNLPIYISKDSISTETDDKNIQYTRLVFDATNYKKTSGVLVKETIDINQNIFEYGNI